jgi:hypothetical protein
VWYLNPVVVKDRAAYNAYMAEYMLRRYHRRRATAIEILGGECVVCGRTDDLQIDHIDPAEKSFDLGKLWSVSEARFFAELKKCQLLCGPHHRDKTRVDLHKMKGNRIVLEHGTLSMYRYCKCDKCKAAKSRSNKEQREARLRS